jgi:hypothetical protein
MAFDLNQFIQQGLIFGGARVDKFDIQLTLPTPLAGIDPGATNKLTFTCKAASIPAFHLGEVGIPYFGRKIKSAGDRVWDNWRITVMLDEDYMTRAMFEAWNNAINRVESNVMQANFDGELYKTNWNVTHYSKDGGPIRQYQIINGWPKTIGQIALSWEGTDRIAEFEVEVPFDNFAPADGGENPWKNSTSTSYLGQIDSVG